MSQPQPWPIRLATLDDLEALRTEVRALHDRPVLGYISQCQVCPQKAITSQPGPWLCTACADVASGAAHVAEDDDGWPIGKVQG